MNKKFLLISPKYKLNTFDTPFNFTFPIYKNTDIKKIKLKYLSGPLLYYNITALKKNNIINFIIPNLFINVTLTIKDGYYGYYEIVTLINNFLLNNGINNNTLNIDYDSNALIFFFNTSNILINVNFNGGFYYGFDNNNIFIGGIKQQGKNPPQLSLPNFIFIKIGEYHNNSIIQGPKFLDFSFSIPINVQTNEYLQFAPNSQYEQDENYVIKTNEETYRNINIEIRDQWGDFFNCLIGFDILIEYE